MVSRRRHSGWGSTSRTCGSSRTLRPPSRSTPITSRSGGPAATATRQVRLFYRSQDLGLQKFLTASKAPEDTLGEVAHAVDEHDEPVRPAELKREVDSAPARTRAVNLLEQAEAVTTDDAGRLEYLDGELRPLSGRWTRRSALQIRIQPEHYSVLPPEQRHLAQAVQHDQPRAHAVVDIVIVVRDLVGEIGELRFEAGCRRLRKRSPTSPSLRALCASNA